MFSLLDQAYKESNGRIIPFSPVRMVVTLAYGLLSKKKTGEGLRNIYKIWSRLVEL